MTTVSEHMPGYSYGAADVANDAEWGNLFMTPSAFLALVYQGV
jgi:hypothetical protein